MSMNDESNLFDPINELRPKAASLAAPLPDPFVEEALDRGGLGGVIEALLKRPGRIRHALRGGLFGVVGRSLAVVAVVALSIYGLVAGSLSGGVQLWAAPVKVLLGSLAAAAICFPSLYVFLCLSGADTRIREVGGTLVAMVALSSVLLLGLAPVAWVFSQSTDSVALMTILHLAFWAASVAMGARLASRFLGSANGRAKIGAWLAIYMLVSLQMMTSLRPIIGNSDTFLPTEKKFFLGHLAEVLEGGVTDDGRRARGSYRE